MPNQSETAKKRKTHKSKIDWKAQIPHVYAINGPIFERLIAGCRAMMLRDCDLLRAQFGRISVLSLGEDDVCF